MRYLFVYSGRDWSGAARFMAMSARGLAERGHDVTVLADTGSAVEWNAKRFFHSSGGTATPVHQVSRTLRGSGWRAMWSVRATARRVGAQVVCVHTRRDHWLAALAYRLGSKAVVLRRMTAGTLRFSFGDRAATKCAPTVLAWNREGDIEHVQRPRRALANVVIPPSVDAPAHVTSREMLVGQTIVCLHAGASRERLAPVIRALAMLAPRHPDLRLVLVGGGTYNEDVRMQAAALRVLNLITFVDEYDAALPAIRTALFGWVVSPGDTGVLSLLDMMHLGVPVLASTETVAEQYTLSNITGIVLPHDDPYQTAALLANVFTHPEQIDTMGEAARVHVTRTFPPDATLDAFEEAATLATRRRR